MPSDEDGSRHGSREAPVAEEVQVEHGYGLRLFQYAKAASTSTATASVARTGPTSSRVRGRR